jgi:hypothetical protein
LSPVGADVGTSADVAVALGRKLAAEGEVNVGGVVVDSVATGALDVAPLAHAVASSNTATIAPTPAARLPLGMGGMVTKRPPGPLSLIHTLAARVERHCTT